MARTLSNMLPLGTMAPGFTLPDTISGNTLSLDDLKSDKATVILFICNHCPYVIHINEALVQLVKEYQAKGVSFVGISSNDVINYPQDAPDKMKIQAETVGYTFPYLYDESQEIAKAYEAACTPDIYVFDRNLELIYRGQMDDSRPDSGIPVTGKDLRDALDAELSGQATLSNQKPSMGCGIKWKL